LNFRERKQDFMDSRIKKLKYVAQKNVRGFRKKLFFLY